MSSILDETTNFISLYMHHCGESEVPKEFHFWSCISLIAACVGDHVWLETIRDSPLYPNLYTVLVGPSGLGKGVAINIADRYAQGTKRILRYRGRATTAHIIDVLARQTKDGIGSKMYLVTPELAVSVGTGDLANDFIKRVTDWYECHRVLNDGTRMHGGKILKDMCINWLAGTTKEWLMECVPRSAMDSGFGARTIIIQGKYNPAVRVPEPKYPQDYDEVAAHLAARVKVLTYVEGQFTRDDEAKRLRDYWYQTREAPHDEALMPVWQRDPALVDKLSMILALADGVDDLVIRKAHEWKAQELTKLARAAMADVLDYASATRDTHAYDYVKRKIIRFGTLTHTTLARQCSPVGIDKKKLEGALDMLISERRIQVTKGPRGGRTYTWIRRKVTPITG